MKKILCVEDDELVMMGYEMAAEDMQSLDLEFHFATDYAESASLLANKGPFDLIISDHQFPGMEKGSMKGGPELLRLAGRIAPATPFVFVSGLSPAQIETNLRNEGFTKMPERIFTKPLTLEVVVASLLPYIAPAKPPIQSTENRRVVLPALWRPALI